MESTTSLVLASGNAGKLREIEPLLAPLGWDVRAQSEWGLDEAVEDGLTFVENALIKARHAAENTGFPALADDSGLVVDVLDGRPGLRSARYARISGDDGEPEVSNPEANNLKLLDELQGVPEEKRNAHFVCVMVFLRQADDPAPLIASGKWQGRIMTSPRGQGGFGYDPVFYVPDRDVTAAELPLEVKNAISHRGQALASMLRMLRAEKNT